MSSLAPSTPRPNPGQLAAHSRFAQRITRRYAQHLRLLPPGAVGLAQMQQCLHALQAPTLALELGAALRVLRQLVLLRLVERDCSSQASLEEVTTTMTELAELALDAACTQARALLDSRHGQPQDAQGQAVQFWVVGMGKLGARELNVSSDIDLIYVYEHEGETTGRDATGKGCISNHEYFSRVAKTIYQLIGEVTEHGQVFRIDLALRPHGNSGATAIGLAALDSYLQTHGREWERFAWLKSRILAPRSCVQSTNVQALRTVVLPFVFRRYLDYNVFDALRDLHRQIRQHASRRSSGQPGRSHDVKLSAGGIRELEFTVQLQQVVRGGQYPELRCRPTLEALRRLVRAELMPADTAEQLALAYRFLRQVEHRIQYLDDQQTHVLPTDDADLAWLAHSMGYANSCQFLHQLDAWRELVAQEFDALLGGADPCPQGICHLCDPNDSPGSSTQPQAAVLASAPSASNPSSPNSKAPSGLSLQDLPQQLPAPLGQRVAQWCNNPKLRQLRPATCERLQRLLQQTGQWLQAQQISPEAALRFVQWLEPLLRRDSYLALLLERPSVHQRLLHVLGAATWPARYLQQHPGVIDELASDQLLHERFDPAAFTQEIETRRQALRSTGEDDDESLLNLLRRAHHAEVFRTLVRDVAGAITVEQVADDLSALADSVLRITSQWCWPRLKQRHREEPQFAIIGYGKLGGKELGYGSDLDIVFVFDDEDERAPQVYAAFVRKLINWLTVKTSEGDLFEIDTQLRPNGNSGLLVTSFAAYADYQQQRGSNTAWTWEHQAMTRARFILGRPDLEPRFEAVRQAVMTAPRNPQGLRQEILDMRQRLRQAYPVAAGRFDLKHSPGGMLDAEFAVQYLLLLHAQHHPSLLGNLGNIALLLRAEEVGLLPTNTGQQAAHAYRQLRRLQHLARLNDSAGPADTISIAPYRDAVLHLWHCAFTAE